MAVEKGNFRLTRYYVTNIFKLEYLLCLGNNHLIFLGGGGGQEDLTEPDVVFFFFAYFWSRSYFWPAFLDG